jgi:hypothetical protein
MAATIQLSPASICTACALAKELCECVTAEPILWEVPASSDQRPLAVQAAEILFFVA